MRGVWRKRLPVWEIISLVLDVCRDRFPDFDFPKLWHLCATLLTFFPLRSERKRSDQPQGAADAAYKRCHLNRCRWRDVGKSNWNSIIWVWIKIKLRSENCTLLLKRLARATGTPSTRHSVVTIHRCSEHQYSPSASRHHSRSACAVGGSEQVRVVALRRWVQIMDDCPSALPRVLCVLLLCDAHPFRLLMFGLRPCRFSY